MKKLYKIFALSFLISLFAFGSNAKAYTCFGFGCPGVSVGFNFSGVSLAYVYPSYPRYYNSFTNLYRPNFYYPNFNRYYHPRTYYNPRPHNVVRRRNYRSNFVTPRYRRHNQYHRR